MTRPEIEAFYARRQEAWNRLDAAALAADFTDEAVVESPLAGGVATGREAIEKLYHTYFAAFTDMRVEQQMLLIDGDNIALLARITGTNVGGFMGMPATGRPIAASLALFNVVRDGKIVRERRVYDFTGVLVQAGLLRAKPI